MSATIVEQAPTNSEQVDRAVGELTAAKPRFARLSLADRRALLEDCLNRVADLAPEWVELACEAKGIPAGSPMRAEEVAAGPLATARHLRLLIQNYLMLERSGKIDLPTPPRTGHDGTLRVGVDAGPRSVRSDRLFGLQGRSLARAGASAAMILSGSAAISRIRSRRRCSCWAPGNVSSIPATDTISKLFQEGHVVLLKMNPVNEYLGPVFQRLFARLIELGYVRIIYGGAQVGAAAVEHPAIEEVHITGSIHSHDAIAWGPAGPERDPPQARHDPVLKKPITSELGQRHAVDHRAGRILPRPVAFSG